MRNHYTASTPQIVFAVPSTQLVVLGAGTYTLSAVCLLVWFALSKIPTDFQAIAIIAEKISSKLTVFSVLLLIVGSMLFVAALILYRVLPDTTKIRVMVRKGLFCYEYGNPLHLKEGERLPKVKCEAVENGIYRITVSATVCTVDDIQNASMSISSALNRKYARYAVTQTDVDVAFNEVRFLAEDVTVDRSLMFNTVEELRPVEATKLTVQDGTYIDLTTSGSMLFAGKTRSGKTTGVIAILLQALIGGRDKYGSEILIVDPKQAELSRLPHVVTLDTDGEAREILDAIRRFAETIVVRQRVLNDLSEQVGDAVKWWDAGFHVSILFIDEYVALRGIFPKRASKEDGEYNLSVFDALIKRIITMGASAGCYVIISIAEASVEEGGLPAMLRSAMTTKVLFKPTLPEARLMWNSEKLKDFPERVYGAGDAWLSSTDGIHDRVTYVHFPVMQFAVYRELGALLERYYSNND